LILLRNVPGLATLCDPLLANHITNAREITVGVPEAQQFGSEVLAFNQVVTALEEALDAALPPQDPLAADLRIPQFNSVKALADFLQDMEIVFHSVVEIAPATEVPATGEPCRFNRFDIGSNWVVVVAISPFVLASIYRRWREAARIAAFMQTRAVIREQESLLKIGVQHAKAAQDAFDKLIGAMTQEAIKSLRGEAAPLDPETQQRAAHAVGICAEAIERGARLVLSNNAPEEIAKLVPSLAEQEKLVASPPMAALPQGKEEPEAPKK
jgi:hypothetical protein